MGKKQTPKLAMPVQSSPGLKHSPFAALGGAPAPAAEAVATPAAPPSEIRGRVVLRRETKHRGGKAVVVIDGFDRRIDDATLESLAKQLKSTLGCGGTLEATNDTRQIVLQGDQPVKVAEFFRSAGFSVAGVTS